MDKLKAFQKMVRTDVPLAMHTWLQLGGPAEYFAEPRTEQELLELLTACHEESVPVRVLGMGSNILASDSGVPGLVIRLTNPVFCDIQTEPPWIECGGGAKLGRVVTSAVTAGLSGIEGLIGIPGTVGGAISENVSTNDGDLGQWVDSLRIMTFTGKTVELSRQEIVFGYRSCSLENAIILSARLHLEKGETRELSRRLQKIWITRKKTQPMGNYGMACIFKDPRGQRVSELIEEAGLVGTRIGGAVICDRNPNFILAEPECSCDDVKRLIRLIQAQVREQTEVNLELELKLW